MDQIIRRLFDRGPASTGIAVDAEGAMLGPDCVLVRRTPEGYRCIDETEAAALQDCLFSDRRDSDWLFGQCRRIAKALDNHDVPLAQILGLYVPIGDLDAEQLKRLALTAPLIKADFNPDELRIPKGNPHGGEWTTSGGSDGTVGDAGRLDAESVAYQGYFHDAVVAYLRDALTAVGSTVITSVPLTALDGTTAIVDMMVRPIDYPTYILEVKTGKDPQYTPAQQRVYPMAQIGGHVTSSKSTLSAVGLTPGQKLPPLRIVVCWARAPGQEIICWWEPPPQFVQ